jgi:hypothetical protein
MGSHHKSTALQKPLKLLLMGAVLGAHIMGAASAQVSPRAADPYLVEGPEVHQLRIYELFDRNKDAFHARFRDHAVRIMKRYGFDIVSMWEAKSGERSEFVYVIRWPDEDTMKSQWKKFMADPEWARIKVESAQEHGPMVGKIEERVMRLTAYRQ